MQAELQQAARLLLAGKVVICPTEGVYGFSCVFDDEEAIKRIIALKERSDGKGLIVVCSSMEEALFLTDESRISAEARAKMQQLWPGPHTFVLPFRKELQGLLTGFRDTIAVRVSAYQVVHDLCLLTGKPLVSTSANISGHPAIKALSEVQRQFADAVDYVIPLPCQGMQGPSAIHDGITGKLLRNGGK